MKINRAKPEDAKTERYIIISMIVSDDICRSVRKTYQSQYFQTKLTKEVAKWCMEFFDKYDAAPKQDVQSLFEMKSKAGQIDPDLSDEIEQFLASLSEEYEEWEDFNIQYYIELTNSYFKKRSFVILSDQIREAAENNDVAEAERRYSNYTKIQEQQDTSRKLLEEQGVDEYRISLESVPPFLFQMPGALGELIGPINRETLVGVLGQEKAGKTFTAQMMAKAAAKQGKRVLLMETGDMTLDQFSTRFYSDLTGKTAHESKAGERFVPVLDCLRNQLGACDRVDNEPIVLHGDKGQYEFIVDIKDADTLRGHEPCTECFKDRRMRKNFRGSIWWEEKDIKQWTYGEARKKAKQFKKWFKGEIISEAYPMGTVRMSDVRDWIINRQKQDGWMPDVVIIDYPDIMMPENDKDEYRHRENKKWMLARQISQEFHCCVVLFTQADAKAYGRDTLKLDNYSEDKRKYAHCTHFFALNKTAAEEEMGCVRMSTLLLREDSIKISQQVTILQQLETATPYTASFFGRVPGIMGK